MRIAVLCVALTVGLAACGSRKKPVPKPQPVTQVEAEAFAKQLQAALEPCDAGELAQLLDMEALGRFAIAPVEAPLVAKRIYVRRVREQGPMMAGLLCADTSATYSLLRLRENADSRTVLFRSEGEEGFDYVEFYVGKTPKGEVKAYDFHSYGGGARQTVSQRSFIEARLANARDHVGADSLNATLDEARALANRGLYAAARDKLNGLPASIRNTEAIMLEDVGLAAGMDEETYLAAMDRYEVMFPNSPAGDIVAIDASYLRKDYQDVVERIGRLDARVGGDPYLDFFRGGLLVEAGKHNDAGPWLEKTLRAEPEREEAHMLLVRVRLHQERFEEVVEILRYVDANFEGEIDRTSLVNEPEYAAFAASGPGKAYFGGAE